MLVNVVINASETDLHPKRSNGIDNKGLDTTCIIDKTLLKIKTNYIKFILLIQKKTNFLLP